MFRPPCANALSVASAYLVVMSSVPPTTWLNRSLWLFAGVAYAGRYSMHSAARA